MKAFKNVQLPVNYCQAIEMAGSSIKSEFPVEMVILFGSQSRECADDNSDTDLLIVTLRPLNWREEKAIIDRLFDIGMQYDVIFSPLFASHDEWEGGIFQDFPIYSDIMRDGALVA